MKKSAKILWPFSFLWWERNKIWNTVIKSNQILYYYLPYVSVRINTWHITRLIFSRTVPYRPILLKESLRTVPYESLCLNTTIISSFEICWKDFKNKKIHMYLRMYVHRSVCKWKKSCWLLYQLNILWPIMTVPVRYSTVKGTVWYSKVQYCWSSGYDTGPVPIKKKLKKRVWHTYIHTYIHTYSHTHTHTRDNVSFIYRIFKNFYVSLNIYHNSLLFLDSDGNFNFL